MDLEKKFKKGWPIFVALTVSLLVGNHFGKEIGRKHGYKQMKSSIEHVLLQERNQLHSIAKGYPLEPKESWENLWKMGDSYWTARDYLNKLTPEEILEMSQAYRDTSKEYQRALE